MTLEKILDKYNPRVIASLPCRDAQEEMALCGVHSEGVRLMGARAEFLVVRLDSVGFAAARALKEVMLSMGADAALEESVWVGAEAETPVVITATRRQYKDLLRVLTKAGGEQADLCDALVHCLDGFCRREFTIGLPGGPMRLKTHAPLVMGILNVTPDSFSDGGAFFDTAAAVDHAFTIEEQGADIIDIGGESTRPGSLSVSAEEETERVVPVIEALAGKIGCPLSIDTSKPEVAEAALDAGAAIINDVTALADERMATLAADKGCPVILMHMKGTPRTMQKSPFYRDLMGEITLFLRRRVERAVSAGVERDRIIIDPGIGFGKTAEHNLNILRRLKVLASLGRPILVGVSRKSFLGKVTGAPVTGRRIATAAANALAAAAGAHILRVHDVAEAKEAAAVAAAVETGRIREEH